MCSFFILKTRNKLINLILYIILILDIYIYIYILKKFPILNFPQILIIDLVKILNKINKQLKGKKVFIFVKYMES